MIDWKGALRKLASELGLARSNAGLPQHPESTRGHRFASGGTYRARKTARGCWSSRNGVRRPEQQSYWYEDRL